MKLGRWENKLKINLKKVVMRKDLQPMGNAQKRFKPKQNHELESVILSPTKSFVRTHTNLEELSFTNTDYSYVVEWQMPEEEDKIYSHSDEYQF